MTRPRSKKGILDKKLGRGRPANPTPLSRRTVEIPDDLWAWALSQPEGGARLIRDLLGLEWNRRSRAPSAKPDSGELKVATSGGTMVANKVPEGLVILFEEELALQCFYDVHWKRLLIQVPVKIDNEEERMASARQQDETHENESAANTVGQ